MAMYGNVMYCSVMVLVMVLVIVMVMVMVMIMQCNVMSYNVK